MTRAVEVRVTGRVQGVSYRWTAAQEAERLGLSGWVRNEPDGSVAAHVEGPDEQVAAMLDWCRHGPSGARVDDVSVSDTEPSGAPEGFRVAY